MSPGHLIPMVDIARLVAAHGVKVSIATTPRNISRFQNILIRDQDDSDLHINIHKLEFPFSEANLPETCESLDSLPTRLHSYNFSKATMMLQPQGDELVRQHRPDAIVSDMNLPWTADVADKYGIPRIIFHGTCCFSLSVSAVSAQHNPNANNTNSVSYTQPFLLPGLPDPVYVTKSQMPGRFFGNTGLEEFFAKFIDAETKTYGTVANTFCELEPKYVDCYAKITGKKVWPVGPVSLFNTKTNDIAERGNRASIDKDLCLSWLDSKKPNSVLYICFGSLCVFARSQFLELGFGLEASKSSFIWVIKDNNANEPVVLPEGFEERVKDRGLIIRGWAPQVLILNHPAVGGFMTHCGWNSVLESVTAGVPLITWPLFGEQFFNENFVLNQLGIGVGIGVHSGLAWGEEERIGALVKRDRVEETVNRLMGGDESVEGMRKRASQLGELAKAAVGKGGSSNINIGRLLEDLFSLKKERLETEVQK